MNAVTRCPNQKFGDFILLAFLSQCDHYAPPPLSPPPLKDQNYATLRGSKVLKAELINFPTNGRQLQS